MNKFASGPIHANYLVSLSSLSFENREVSRDRRRLNNRAHKNPSTRNPCTNLPASRTMMALITNRNKPNVRIVMGKVKMISRGFTNTFRIAKTMESVIAVQKVSIWIPGKTAERPYATTAVTRMRRRKFMRIFSPS
jgi:hypothetical protein